MNDPIDPRLVALGLVPPPATEKRPADLQEARPAAPPAPPPPAPKAKPRAATPHRAPGPLDRFLPPSYTEEAAPPAPALPATPPRAPGPLDAFLTAPPAAPPVSRPAPERPIAPQRPIAPRPTAPPPVPLATTRVEPVREAAPPPLPPLASAMPSEAPITLSAGAIAAAQDALTVKQGRAKAEKAPKLPKAEKAEKPPKLPKAPKLPKMAKVAAEAVPFVSTLPPSAVLLRGPIAMGVAERRQQLTLEHLGMRIDAKVPIEVAWTEVQKIRTRRGRVVIHAGKRQVVFGVPVEGVIEPALAAPLARVVDEAKTGSLDLAGSAFLELQNATDSLRDRFSDEDDPIIPAIVALVFVLAGSAVAALLPQVIVFTTRSSVAPGQFLISSRLSSLDPRMLVAGFAAGAMLAALVIRLAMGQTGQLWARGTLRRWDVERFGAIGRLARRGLAHIVLGPSIAAGLLLVAFLLSLPSARDETIIDESGFRITKELPFFDETRFWRDVTDITTVPAPVSRHTEGFAVIINFANNSPVTTVDRDLRGGTDKQLQQKAIAWRDTSR